MNILLKTLLVFLLYRTSHVCIIFPSFCRLWKASGVCTHALEGHSDVVAYVGIINPEGAEAITLATASKDRTRRLWKFDTEEPINNPINVRAFKILRGHRESVQSVAAQKTGDMVCSGSWDSTINLWRTNDNTDGDLVSIKKRKVNDQADESQLEGEAVSTLVGHTQCVSSVVWPQNETIYSASWDHSVRRWDVETGKDLTDSVNSALHYIFPNHFGQFYTEIENTCIT
ncbi:ribosome biogenesis protein WDR12 homolog [Carya illinoinensis]|uniref:ribosome biogenesis protein WDR12 homolog n=1 Tax=Carya illinoinensis TaxID=32201 RepID=UPI001C7189F4|nr:ribosome biogenesis protein WDR12 homolog [Carya illinoinensis]